MMISYCLFYSRSRWWGESEFRCEQARQVLGGETVGGIRHLLPQAAADPLLPHADGHAAQQVPEPGPGVHEPGADHEAPHDAERGEQQRRHRGGHGGHPAIIGRSTVNLVKTRNVIT